MQPTSCGTSGLVVEPGQMVTSDLVVTGSLGYSWLLESEKRPFHVGVLPMELQGYPLSLSY